MSLEVFGRLSTERPSQGRTKGQDGEGRPTTDGACSNKLYTCLVKSTIMYGMMIDDQAFRGVPAGGSPQHRKLGHFSDLKESNPREFIGRRASFWLLSAIDIYDSHAQCIGSQLNLCVHRYDILGYAILCIMNIYFEACFE